MGNSHPHSLLTRMGKALAAPRKLASFSLVKGPLRSISGMPAAALAGVVIMFFVWSCERQARQRDTVEARQVKKQAAEEISRLQQEAAGAVRDARQSAQAAQALEAQRQQLAREAEGLRQSLASLRQQELARVNEVATLPTSEVVSRVASRLQEQVSGVGSQVSGQRPLNPLTRPALADESASAGHPLPQGGEGQNNQGGEGQKSPAVLVLPDAGVRKVETAFVELDSCRQQAQVMGQQVSNCEQQEKLDSSIQDQQSDTIAKLKVALADKDQVLARSEDVHRAELKAARGTFRAHFIRAVEIFAGGFIAGVLLR